MRVFLSETVARSVTRLGEIYQPLWQSLKSLAMVRTSVGI